MEQSFIEITAEELAMLIGGIYYSSEEDLSDTEDLIKYLEEHPDQSVFLNKN